MFRLLPGRGARFGLMAGVFAASLAALPAALQAQSTRLSGDVTNDNTVDQVDAQAVLRGIIDLPMGAGQDLTYGDANCDGRVTAIDAQIILMKAASVDVSALCVGRQVGAPVAAITVDPATGSVVAAGFPLQLNATPLDGSNTALTFKTIIWTSSDVSKATVSSTGVVQGVAAGSVNISATNGTITTIVPILVVPTAPEVMTVSPSAALADAGRTVPLTLEIRDIAGNLLPDRAVVWSSSNPKVAAVDASTGLVTGVAPGTATITADAGNGVKGTSVVTVVSTGAVTRTWSGQTSTDWNVASNWVENAVPVPTDTVQIPAGTPNVATLTARTTIAGVKVLEDATLAMGANELQITGRLEVDGTITGTGKLNTQGLNQSTTYVRGALPNLTVTGQTELTDNVTIAGSLEINPVSTLRIRGRKLDVAQDLSVRGGIIMTEKTDILDVRGNARFFNDAGMANAPLRPVWTTGTFRLGGNLVVYSPVKTTVSPLQASGTNRIILNGSGAQIVADTGVVTVPLQELDVSTGSVEFRSFAWNSEPDSSSFVFSGRIVGTIASTISGGGRVVALKNLTTAGGTVSLRNLSVRGLIVAAGTFTPDTLTMLGGVSGEMQLVPSGAPYAYKALVIAGMNKLAGTTNVGAGLTLGCLTTIAGCAVEVDSLVVGGNTLTVTGDVRQSPLSTTSPLVMDNAADVVIVNGGLLGPVGTTVGVTPNPTSLPVEFTVSDGDWTKGGIKVRGNVALRGTGPTTNSVDNSHIFRLDGSSQQALRLNNGFNFNTLEIANTTPLGVIHDDTTLAIRTAQGRFRTGNVWKNLTISTATALAGTGKLTVQGDVQTAAGSSVSLNWIAIGSVQRVSGTWAPDTTEYSSASIAQTIQNLSGYKHVIVSGKAAFGGNISIANGLNVMTNGELDMERRSVLVTGTTAITGVLRMQDARDTLTIDGNVNFNRTIGGLPTQTLVTAGVLRVTGNIEGAKAGGFYPTGTHKTIWTTGNATEVRGDYNHFEVATKILGSGVTNFPTIKNATVRGALTAKDGLARLVIDTLTVNGSADLTQTDTVITATALSKVDFQADLKVRKFKVFGFNRVTAKNVEVVDGGVIVGQIVYSGTYTESGTISNPEFNTSVISGLSTIAWTTQPTPVQVNTAVSPAPVAELRNSAGQLILGTQYAMLTATGGNVNGAASVRVKFVDGVLTLSNVQFNSAGTQSLRLSVVLSTGVTLQATSTAVVVSP